MLFLKGTFKNLSYEPKIFASSSKEDHPQGGHLPGGGRTFARGKGDIYQGREDTCGEGKGQAGGGEGISRDRGQGHLYCTATRCFALKGLRTTMNFLCTLVHQRRTRGVGTAENIRPFTLFVPSSPSPPGLVRQVGGCRVKEMIASVLSEVWFLS